jgi:hypothetical protein
MRNKTQFFLAAALIAAGLAGCGNESSPQATAKRRADAQAALEVAAKAGGAGMAGEISQALKQDQAQFEKLVKALTNNAANDPKTQDKHTDAKDVASVRKQ